MEKEFSKQMELQAGIIQQEAKNGSGLWRVRLMYLCMFLVFAHWVMYDLVLYLRAAFDWNFYVTYPPPDMHYMWDFLKIGVGGYIASRGIEKSVAWWRKGR
jgi:hypothetical protein